MKDSLNLAPDGATQDTAVVDQQAEVVVPETVPPVVENKVDLIVAEFDALVDEQLAEGELIQPEKVWEKVGNMLCTVTIECANKYGNRMKISAVGDERFKKIIGCYVKSDRRVAAGGIPPGRMALYMVKAKRTFTPQSFDNGRVQNTITIGQRGIRLY